MKKVLTTLLAVMLAVVCLASVVSAADVSVNLDGKKLEFEQPPVIIEGRTLVPLRAIFEALGASVEWDDATKTVTSAKDDVTIKLAIGSNVLYRNGEGKELDVPAQIVGAGYTMVPARAIAEAYGVSVDWDDATKTVLLTSPVKEDKVEGAVLNLVSADTFVPDARIYTSSTVGKDLVVVNNPLDANDKVFFLENTTTDKNAWTYFWVNKCDYKPGQKYIVTFDILAPSTDSHGNPVNKISLGINFKYGVVGEASKDHGATSDNKPSTVVAVADKWTRCMYINSMPENLDTASDMRFGIYSNPKDAKNYSYYIDNISILPYTGSHPNGVVDVAAIEAAEKLAKLDVNAIEGLAYEFDTLEPFVYNKIYSPEIIDGELKLTVPEGASSDVQGNLNATSFNAADYNRVAFKVKCDAEGFEKSYFALYFGTDSDPKLSQSKCVSTVFSTCKVTDDGYYVGVLNMDANEFWKGEITSLRFDPMQNVFGSIYIDRIVLFKE